MNLKASPALTVLASSLILLSAALAMNDTDISGLEEIHRPIEESDINWTAASKLNSDIYRISDSPYMRLTDIEDWVPIVPPEPRDVEGGEDPTAVEMYDVATGDTILIPSEYITQLVEGTDLNLTPPFEGLLSLEVMPSSVFPPDDRVQIADTNLFPWRTICRLFITMPDGTRFVGSGALIGSEDGHGYHVLTAGHCVYDSSHGGWASSIKVVPGLDGDYMPYYCAWSTRIRSYTGWTQDRDTRHDWAVITLDRNVGDLTGWMGRKTADSSSSIYKEGLHTAGYPGDKGDLTMWYDFDYGRTANEYNHWYYMDTYSGQSGSPVWRKEDSSRYILTVHTFGDDGSGSNHGTRLNRDKFDRINTWCGEDTPPTDKADLIDDGQSWSGFSPATIRPSQNFNVWCDVRNIGTAASGGFYVSYYASTNKVISTSDYHIGTDYVSSISPFGYGDSEWSGSFPSIPAGTYYVGWIIDRSGEVSEFDETNNVAYKDSYQLVVNPNRVPTAPSIPSGPTSGTSGTSYSYTTSASDPDGDQVKYTFDWADGTTSTTGFVNSGTSASMSHSWTVPAGSTIKYNIRAKATDSKGASSVWSNPLSVYITGPNRVPTTPTIPVGPTSGTTGTSYSYSTSANDPDGDQVKYTFDWGDGTTSVTALVDSGTIASEAHAWTTPGQYCVKAKATDSMGAVSPFSEAKLVTISDHQWNCLGGYLTSTPSMIQDAEGQIHIFVRGGDNSLWENVDGTWAGLGGYITSDPYAVMDDEGQIHIFVRGSDGALWDRMLDGGWVSLGGGIASNPSAALLPGSGHLKIAVIGEDNALWINDFDTGTLTGSWSGLGGVITSNPYVIIDGLGVMRVFVRGSDGALYENANGNWISHGGYITSDAIPAFGPGPALCTFVRGGDGALWKLVEGASWTGLGGYIAPADEGFYKANPAMVTDSSGELRAFVCSGDGALWFNRLGEWYPTGGVLSSDSSAIFDEETGLVHVAARGSDGQLWICTTA